MRQFVPALPPLLTRMQTEYTTQIWTLSEDSNEYERFRTMLDGSLKNSLDPAFQKLPFRKLCMSFMMGAIY
jgi:hypothetical protein